MTKPTQQPTHTLHHPTHWTPEELTLKDHAHPGDVMKTGMQGP